VDARIAGITATVTWRRLKDIVAAAILAADPPKAVDDAEQAAARAGVFLDPETTHGFQTMVINANAGDLVDLDKALDVIAGALEVFGDARSLQQRRATAAGIIADPQAALDLVAQAEQVRQTHREAAAARRAGDSDLAEEIEQTLPDPTAPASWKPFMFKRAVLYYHLSKETLDAILAGKDFAGAGVVRVEDIGPVILDQVKQWLGHSNVVLKPVINLPGIQPVDHYETPPAMSEAIGLIRQADSFPYGTCTSRHQDNEHDAVPPDEPRWATAVTTDRPLHPAQTGPATQPETRPVRHHRMKTFGGWTVHQVRPGAWLFRSPHGYYYLVDQLGTTSLGKL
jgi:hypothetical protein